jgi:hypothetical protein
MQQEPATRPVIAFHYAVLQVFRMEFFRPTKKPFILSIKDEEHQHLRGTTFVRHYLTIAASVNAELLYSSLVSALPARSRGPPAKVYSHNVCDFFLQRQGSFSQGFTCELSTSRSLSAWNENLLLVPSSLFLELFICPFRFITRF